MSTIDIYGIPNCDTIKKTLEWFRKNKIDVNFHDYKKEGITRSKLQAWSKEVGWETLLNRKGTTWRKIDPVVQAGITNATAAIKLMAEQTSLIKRPVIETEKGVIVGFDENIISSLIKNNK